MIIFHNLDPTAAVQAKIINYSKLRIPVSDEINPDDYMLTQEGNNKWAFLRRNEDQDMDELNQRIKLKPFYTTSNYHPIYYLANISENPMVISKEVQQNAFLLAIEMKEREVLKKFGGANKEIEKVFHLNVKKEYDLLKK